jgi:hypothetical protein
MPTREEFIAEVTQFFAEPKTLAGIGEPVAWQPNRDPAERCIKLPIEVNGAQNGQSLVLVARPARGPMDFSISVIYGVGVCRLDFDETGGHNNGFGPHLGNLPPVVVGSHFHRWNYNARFVEGDLQLLELKNAEEIPNTIRSFDSCLRWFCDEANIALPHNHHIALPDTLLI